MLTVHYRRGDKISSHESRDIPVNEYVEAVAFKVASHEEIDTIVFVSDDETAVIELLNTVSKAVPERVKRLVTWRQARSDSGILPQLSLQAMHGWLQSDFGNWPAADRKLFTQDFLLSLTVMAQSAYTICTYSSNICRFI